VDVYAQERSPGVFPRDVSENPGPDPDLTPALLAGVREIDLEMLQQTAALLQQS
jgi:hypothetical protein